jgi:hypothetical protein
MVDNIIISTIIIVGGALIYKITSICFASKCSSFKFSCKDGLSVQRNVEREQSIRHLNDVEMAIPMSITS